MCRELRGIARVSDGWLPSLSSGQATGRFAWACERTCRVSRRPGVSCAATRPPRTLRTQPSGNRTPLRFVACRYAPTSCTRTHLPPATRRPHMRTHSCFGAEKTCVFALRVCPVGPCVKWLLAHRFCEAKNSCVRTASDATRAPAAHQLAAHPPHGHAPVRSPHAARRAPHVPAPHATRTRRTPATRQPRTPARTRHAARRTSSPRASARHPPRTSARRPPPPHHKKAPRHPRG